MGTFAALSLKVAAFLLILYLGACLLLYIFQDRMIFFPQPTSPAAQAAYEAHVLCLQNGAVSLTGWFFDNGVDGKNPLIVYYGGNAEDVSLNFRDLDRFATRSFLFMNYRGYGGSGGRPSEEHLFADALVVLDRILAKKGIDPAHVVLMGRSLGAAVAVHVAARRKVGGIILVTPFDALINVARVHYPIFPIGMLLKHPFDSFSLASKISTPALFLIASDDRVVPPRFASRLAAAWGGPINTVTVEGTGHNTIETTSAYWQAINEYLERR